MEACLPQKPWKVDFLFFHPNRKTVSSWKASKSPRYLQHPCRDLKQQANWKKERKIKLALVFSETCNRRENENLNRELPDVQASFRKGRGNRDQIASICWIMQKAREFQKKTSIYALLTVPKPLTVWITINCGKFFKRWEYQNTWPASWETYMQVRKQQLELDMEQQTGNRKRSTSRLYIVTLLI